MRENTQQSKPFSIILFNKPHGVLSQFRAEKGVACLSDYIHIKNFYAAGRLDKDSEGLMILTDNGRLQHLISHPQFKLPKTYWVQVEGIPSDSELSQLRCGVTLKDGPTKPCDAELIPDPEIWQRQPPIRFRADIPTTWLQIRLQEGRNRQIRRMTAHIGCPTLRLIRVNVGPWDLNKLQPGETTQLTVRNEDLPQTWQKQLQKTKDTQNKIRHSDSHKKKHRISVSNTRNKK